MYDLVASGCNRNVEFNAQSKVKVIGWQILAGTLNLTSYILGPKQFAQQVTQQTLMRHIEKIHCPTL